jgi:hypothetical protein
VTEWGSTIVELDEREDAVEAMFARGLTDGLPVVPPTPARVDRMLNAGGWSPGEELLVEARTARAVTAHQAAVCAVLAGAPPECFPFIGTAVEAIGDPAFVLYGPLTSTGGAATMVIATGPSADDVGVNGGDALFGPGGRANATIGRAVRLVQLLALDASPGHLDRSTQGWPGRLTLCFGENAPASPWPPIRVALGFDETESTVTVFACESGHAVVNHGATTADALLRTLADSMADLGSFSPGRSVVVLSPEHAQLLRDLGRDGVQGELYERSARRLSDLKAAGKVEHGVEGQTEWTARWLPFADPTIVPGDEEVLVRRGWSPEDILVLVGGGAAGGHSVWYPSWSRSRGTPFVTRRVG